MKPFNLGALVMLEKKLNLDNDDPSYLLLFSALVFARSTKTVLIITL